MVDNAAHTETRALKNSTNDPCSRESRTPATDKPSQVITLDENLKVEYEKKKNYGGKRRAN